MDVLIVMKSGTDFRFSVGAKNMTEITKALNRLEFINFGPITLNAAEIEYIREE